ncbi:MAG: hypothetical protein KAQ92_03975 [Candidatus Aenigmarchaeota archaeon]|nr:hypothetical protein [Candidatus Aenigmarchaeota archaeon]
MIQIEGAKEIFNLILMILVCASCLFIVASIEEVITAKKYCHSISGTYEFKFLSLTHSCNSSPIYRYGSVWSEPRTEEINFSLLNISSN